MQQNMNVQDPMQITQVDKVSLVDSIVEHLISYIVDQKLKPGDKLPKQELLTKLLKVSRVPLREALSRLQALGIISVAHGKGTFVSEFNIQDLLRKLSPILRSQTGISILDIIEVRLRLECSVVELAADRRSEEVVEKLERELTVMQQEVNNRVAFVEHDISFHETLASATNPIFEYLVALFHNLMQISQYKFPDSTEARKTSLEYHKEILKGIKDKNPNQTRNAMRKHIEDIMQRIIASNSIKNAIN